MLMSAANEAGIRENIVEFKDIIWSPYSVVKNNESQYKKQVSSLLYTGLREPNDGIEFTFVPTKNMESLENILRELYSKLRVTEHTISLCNEVFFTSKIEGAQTTLIRTQQIHDGEFIDLSNEFSERMIKGGFEATKYINVVGNNIDSRKLKTCWDLLTIGCKNNTDIEGTLYRSGSVQVGNHVGLNHILLEDMMDRWIRFYNSDILKEHPFIKAAFMHYTFEHIHPFCDGNGRLGRLLMNNLLIKEEYDKIRAVSFSKSIDKDRREYDIAFELSDNMYSDCTYFIEYMLNIMVDAMKDCLGLNDEEN